MSTKYCLWAGLAACLASPLWATPDLQRPAAPDSNRQGNAPLRAFVERLWSDSPAVQGAQAAAAAATAQAAGAARPLHNPSLALDAERTDVTTASIGVSQTLDWSDKRSVRHDLALSEVQIAEAELAATRRRVAAEALDALVAYETAGKIQTLAQRRARLMQRFADTVERRYRAGDMGALDRALARLAYSEALMQQAARESERAQAEAALRAVSGFDVAHWPRLPEVFRPPSEPAPPDVLIGRLPELQVLQSRLTVAAARLRLARKERRPDPTVGLRAGREGGEALLGLSLELPLFVRNDFSEAVQAAAHSQGQQEQAYREARRRALARYQGALARFKNAFGAWNTWVATGQQAHREQMDLLERMWQAAELTATEYLVQARQNVDTQAAAMTLRGQVWHAAIAYLAASGRLETWLGLAKLPAGQSAPAARR
ncbi:MAG TPA: TolC family protein [Gammaproteobacteria bacterium]|nr:TolC family protein [Gammaproteobacteria bacterium]